MGSVYDALGEIKRIIQDRSYSTDDVLLRFVNRAVLTIIGKITIPDLIVTDATVTVKDGKTTAAMPSNFFYPKLFMVRDANGKQFDFSFSVSSIGKYIDASIVKKRINADRCYVIGNNLVLNESANGDTKFLVTYMSTPDEIDTSSLQDDIVPFLPRPFGEVAVIRLASAYIYREIEDGVDDNSVNYSKNLLIANEAMAEIASILGTASYQGRPETIETSVI